MGGKIKIKTGNRKNKTKCCEKGKNRRTEPIKLRKKYEPWRFDYQPTSKPLMQAEGPSRGVFLRLQTIAGYEFLETEGKPPTSVGKAS